MFMRQAYLHIAAAMAVAGCGQSGIANNTLQGPAIVLSPEQSAADGTITITYAGTAPVVDTAVIFPIARASHPWVLFSIAPEDPSVGPPKQYLLSGFNNLERAVFYRLDRCGHRETCEEGFSYRFRYVAGEASFEVPWEIDTTLADPTQNVIRRRPRAVFSEPAITSVTSGDAIGFDRFEGSTGTTTERSYQLAYRPHLVGGQIRFLASPLRHTGNRLPQWLTLTDDSGQTAKIVSTGVAELPLTGNTCSPDVCSQTITLTATLEAPALRNAIAEWQTDWAVRVDVREGADLGSRSANPDEVAFRVVADDAKKAIP